MPLRLATLLLETNAAARRLFAAALLSLPVSLPVMALTTAAGADPALEVSDAWTTGGSDGGEAPLYMTIRNTAGAEDKLLRVRCPVAQFTEKRTTDIGEGAPSARAVQAIAVPPGAATQLLPGGSYVALLQLSEPLRPGATFDCTAAFAHAGTLPVSVTVRGK